MNKSHKKIIKNANASNVVLSHPTKAKVNNTKKVSKKQPHLNSNARNVASLNGDGSLPQGRSKNTNLQKSNFGLAHDSGNNYASKNRNKNVDLYKSDGVKVGDVKPIKNKVQPHINSNVALAHPTKNKPAKGPKRDVDRRDYQGRYDPVKNKPVDGKDFQPKASTRAHVSRPDKPAPKPNQKKMVGNRNQTTFQLG